MQKNTLYFCLHLTLPTYTKKRQKPFALEQYRASRVSIIAACQLLGCPGVPSPVEDMPGDDSAFLMVSFQLQHTCSKVS